MDGRTNFIVAHISGKILDVGYYCGSLHKTLKKFLPNENLYGIDIEGKSNAHYKRASAEKIPFENEFFNSVIAGETIEHLRKPEEFLKEAHRILKPNGLLVLSTPNRGSAINKLLKSYNTKVHLNLFNRKELASLLEKNGFEIENFKMFPYTPESCDGSKHQKLFALRKAAHKFLPNALREDMAVIARKGN